MPFYPFLGEGSPTKIDCRKKLVPLSLLEELDSDSERLWMRAAISIPARRCGIAVRLGIAGWKPAPQIGGFVQKVKDVVVFSGWTPSPSKKKDGGSGFPVKPPEKRHSCGHLVIWN